MKRRWLLLTALCATPVWADGMPDPGFGNNGRVSTDFGALSNEEALAVAVQPDGRIVAAGWTAPVLAVSFMAATRYLTSGALDTSFDGDGIVTIDFGVTPDRTGSAGEVLVQPDGKLVLVGAFRDSSPVLNYALARLHTDGSLDASFGTGGKVLTPLSGALGAGLAAALQPDGRIVVLGSTGSASNPVVALARYNANGTLDATFGTAGQVSVPLAVGFRPTSVALQADGKILVAGSVSSPSDFAVIRLLAAGGLDASFDGDGLATSNFGGTEVANAIAVQPDGRIVVGGYRTPPTDFALVRYLANGALDTGFGAGGLAVADSGAAEIGDGLVVQPDGKLLVAGWTNDTGANDFILVRFNADGTHDTTFGTVGFIRTDFGTAFDQAHALAIGPDRLAVAGSTRSPMGDQDFGVARYIATTPVAATSFSVE